VKKGTVEFLAASALILGCLALTAAPIRWGLPSAERNSLYFRTSESLNAHMALLDKKYVNESFKTFDNYRMLHPDEKIEKLPRSFYNPIRSYHPDEYLPLKMLSQIKPRALDFDTKIYTLGGAHVYVLGFILFMAKACGLLVGTNDLSIYFRQPELIARIFIVGRVLTLIYFAGLLGVTYLAAREISGKSAALFSVAVLGLAPLVNLNAHYMYVDIPALFYLTACLYFTLKICKKTAPLNYIFTGIFGGLAAGTKIQCALVALIIWAAHLITTDIKESSDSSFVKKLRRAVVGKNLLLAAGCFILAFVATNPYSVLKPKEFFFDIARHAPHRIVPLWYFKALMTGMGPAAFILSLVSLIVAVFMKDRRPALLGLWAVIFIGFMSRYGHFFARFALPAIPALVLLLAAVLSHIKSRRPKARHLFALLIFVIIGWNLVWSVSLARLMTGTDARTQAGTWMRKNIAEGASLGVVSDPWQYQMPPIDLSDNPLVITDKDGTVLSEKAPDWFVASSTQFAHDLNFLNGPAYLTFWKKLFKDDYEPIKTINRRQGIFGLRLNSAHFPDDFRNYINPEIIIFKRKSGAGK